MNLNSNFLVWLLIFDICYFLYHFLNLKLEKVQFTQVSEMPLVKISMILNDLDQNGFEPS